MNYKGLLSLAAAATLVGCGGGGGGDGGAAPSTPAAPSAVLITESNAKPVGAHATATAQDASATQGSASLVTGVQVKGGGTAVPNLRAIATLARMGAQGGTGLSMAAGVTIPPTTVSCSYGGSITISGNVSGSAGVTAGDSEDISASSCIELVDGVRTTLSGSLQLRVVSGFMPASGVPPFHVVLGITATKLSVATGSQTSSSNGDLQLDWTETSASVSSITASGSSLSSSTTDSSGTRTTTLRNYSQTVAASGSTMSGRMTASVESTSTVLGSGGGAYSISTPTDLVWTTGNPNPTAGVVKVVGASNSQLRVTYSASAAVLEVDANGDGSYEKTINTTASELKGLL